MAHRDTMVFYSPSRDVVMLGAMVDIFLTDTVEVEGLRSVQWVESPDRRMPIHVCEKRAARTLCGIIIPSVEQLQEGQLRIGVVELENCNKCRQEAARWIKKITGRIG